MFLWTFVVFTFVCGVFRFFSGRLQALLDWFELREQKNLFRVSALLHEIQETIEAGLVPSFEKWAEIQLLPAPWGGQIGSSLESLRKNGAPILPTIKRFRTLSEQHRVFLLESRNQSAQSVFQTGICAAMVPIFGGALFFLLPELEKETFKWLMVCFLAFLLAGVGAIWLFQMADQARWGGLPEHQRHWVLESQIALERFLAWVQSGMTPDLAWLEMVGTLGKGASEIARFWGTSLWESHFETHPGRVGVERKILVAGRNLQKAVHSCVMDGRPCFERVEAASDALSRDIRFAIDRELKLLSTRTLKPLFIFIAPSLMGLLGTAFFLSFRGGEIWF